MQRGINLRDLTQICKLWRINVRIKINSKLHYLFGQYLRTKTKCSYTHSLPDMWLENKLWKKKRWQNITMLLPIIAFLQSAISVLFSWENAFADHKLRHDSLQEGANIQKLPPKKGGDSKAIYHFILVSPKEIPTPTKSHLGW